MLKLAPVFQDNAILQAKKPLRVFGFGDGEITVTAGDASVTVAAENGKWLAVLPEKAYYETCDITVSDGKTLLTVKDVLFGDLYLFSGQSNMELKLKFTTQDGVIAENTDIRIFTAERVIPAEDCFAPKDGWVTVGPETAPQISAVAYYTTRALYRHAARPIGILSASNGASVIESWLSPKALLELDIRLSKEDLFPDHYIESYIWNLNSRLYGLNIEPLLPLSIGGVVWYQGESNTGTGESLQYDSYVSKLIDSWREGFMDPTLPFVIVQIANWLPDPPVEWHNPIGWRNVQKKQKEAADAIPYCYLAVSGDVCETDDIHPPTKHVLAGRIADILTGVKRA